MGGACGYGNLYATGYGTLTAAASIEMWNSGAVCGSCWEVRCRQDAPLSGKYCIPGASVVVTVTNQCPQGSEGGWCDRPQHHLDMAYPAWEKIASSGKAGVVETEMRQVPCPNKDGGVSFMISGNAFWTQVLVYNVAGPGDLAKVEVSADSGETWSSLSRNWGTIWSGGGGLLGHSLSWRLTSIMDSKVLEIHDCIPDNWYLGGTYSCDKNFE